MNDASAPYHIGVQSHPVSLSVAKARSRDLPKKIRAIALNPETHPFDKRRRIAKLIMDSLQERGDFCRTSDERMFFFEKKERRLYDLEETSFARMLTNLSGLSATEVFYKFALDTLQAKEARQARLVAVHSFSYYDAETSR